MGDTRKEEKREVGKEGRKSYKDPFYCLYLLSVFIVCVSVRVHTLRLHACQ